MGNKPCTIGINTDQERYVAGSTIRGMIYLSVTGEALKVSSLNICLIGEEKSVIHYTTTEDHGGGNRRDHRQHHHHHNHTREDRYDRAKHTFFHLDYPLFKATNNRIPVGQYEYPFEIVIPSNLPGSMTYTSGESRCQISYRMIATIHKDNDSNNFLGNIFSSGSYQHTKLIGITSVSGAPVQQQRHMIEGEEENNRFYMPSEIVPIRTCCCWRGNNGTMMLEPEILKINGNNITSNATLFPSDRVTIGLRSKNDSIVAVKDVRIQLEEIIEWTNDITHRRERSNHRSVATDLRLGEDYILQHMPELEKLTEQQQRRRQQQQRRFQRRGGGEESSEQPMMLLPKREFSFAISPNINDTFEGKLISVHHILSVTLETEGCCCTNNPESCTDITIRGKRKQQQHKSNNDYDNNATEVSNHPFSNELDSKKLTNTLEPSAPSFEYDEGAQATLTATTPASSQPSAPSDIYDIMGDFNDIPEATGVIELPPDWSAQTADIVSIPMAHATLL